MHFPQLVAHRGLRHEFPENTVPAIDAALSIPTIDGIEFDVELTADDRLVVIHQETVIANSAFTALDIGGRELTRDWVREKTVKQIGLLDAGSWMDPKFATVRVPELAEVLALPWKEKRAFIELKDATYWNPIRDTSRPIQVVSAFIPYINDSQIKISVISFNPEILSLLNSSHASIPLVLALWTEWIGKVDQAITLAQRCGARAISLPDFVVLEDSTWRDKTKEANIELHAYPVSPARHEKDFENWTADSQREKWRQLTELGIDGLLSDFGRESANSLKGN